MLLLIKPDDVGEEGEESESLVDAELLLLLSDTLMLLIQRIQW